MTRSNRWSTLLAGLVTSAIIPAAAIGQARPDGAHQLWAEVALGLARQDGNCDACSRPGSLAGPTATGVLGLTITERLGVALLARGFQEFSFEYAHSATYYVALAQFSPIHAPSSASNVAFTLNAGVGLGQQHDEVTVYGDRGDGTVLAGGVAVRLPARSSFGVTIAADLMKTVSGTVKPTGGRPSSSYRPLLLTVGFGLGFAGEVGAGASSPDR